ncbi:hypothetical protein TrVE_jg8519 [Triparma verrucosa]|uniref:Uncharacterized protein n=1 Tax=Triparma verrucosa TaxID=1606542 RepID=A0A9W7F442_9STRA|nr:hypothetical protein TrVE_jg8519 [Triparma verrucosa]
MASASPPKALFWGAPSPSSPAPNNLHTSSPYEYEYEDEDEESEDDEGINPPAGSLPLHAGGDFYDASPKKHYQAQGSDDKENVTNGQYGISLDGLVGGQGDDDYDATQDDDAYGDDGDYDDDEKDSAEEEVTTPRMDPNFYHGVETLLSRPPPKFGGNLSKSAKETDAILRKNKQALRKIESSAKSAPARTSNVKSKIDTGVKKGSRKSTGGGQSRQQINPDLLAEAFQYAERLSTMEALSDMPDNDSAAAAVALQTSKSGGTFAGNPLDLARKIRQSSSGSSSTRRPSKDALSGSAYGSLPLRSSSGGGIRSKTKKGGLKVPKKSLKKQSMSYTTSPSTKNSRSLDLEESLKNLQSGLGVEKLRRELEESKRNMEMSSGYLKDAAGEFLQGKFK